MAKQNKVAKLLKILAVSTLCMVMFFSMCIVKASEQNLTPSGTQEQEMQNSKNVILDIETKIKAKGGITKISKSEIKQTLNENDIDSSSKKELLKYFNSLKDFNKDIKSKGGYKKVTLVQIREKLAKYFSYDTNVQEKLFYTIRDKMMSSKWGDPDYPTQAAFLNALLSGAYHSVVDRRWTKNSQGLWFYCNAIGQNCASGWQKLTSSHHYVNGHRDNGYRWYYFHLGNKALRYTSGWWTYQGHTYYNDGVYGMYTNETFTITSHNYHFNNNAWAHRNW